MIRGFRLSAGLLVACVCTAALPLRTANAEPEPASPFEVLAPQQLVPRFIDAGPSCAERIPDADIVKIREVKRTAASLERLLAIRRDVRTATRLERASLESELDALGRATRAPLLAICARLENARLALRMGFGPEAAVELRRARRVLPEEEWPTTLRELAWYLDAESLVAMRRGPEGLELARVAAKSGVPDIALAAQLRVFDLTTRAVIAQYVEAGELPPDDAPSAGPPPSDASAAEAAPEAAKAKEAEASAPAVAAPGEPAALEDEEPRPAAAKPAVAAPGEPAASEDEEPKPAAAKPAVAKTDSAAAAASRDRVAYAQWRILDDLLAEARRRDFDTSSWSVRAAEHALVAKRLSNAHQWLAIAEGVPETRRLAALRKADVLMRLGRPDDARRTLQRVVANSRDAAIRDFARVRLARYALVTEGSAERLELLERAARSDRAVIASIARGQLAIEYLDAGNPDAALEALRKIAYAAPTLPQVPRFSSTVDAAMAASVEEGDCSAVLGRLARTWSLFHRYATKPAPFAVVGDCFVEAGMPKEALLVYRALARSFGVESISHLAWRLASASLDSGELPSARASLRASLRLLGGEVPLAPAALTGALEIPDEAAARWWWLASAFASREGRDAEALHIDLELLGSEHLPAELRPSIEERLVRAIARKPADASRIDPVLAKSLRKDLDRTSPARSLARVQLVDRVWSSGARRVAGGEYRQLKAALDAPTPRSRASYRGAVVVEPADASRELLREAAQDEPFNAWSRLSRVELRMMGLREAVGLPSQVSP